MSVKVSVIIPAYNAEMFIANAINSILEQSYITESEIIVIDDASSDATKAIVSEMSQRHQQIICISNERKKGPSGARNTGILKARGEYIAFLDADDLWRPNHLEEGISFLEKNNNVDIVFFNCEIIEQATKKLINNWFSERSFIEKLRVEELEEQYYLICDDMFNALLDESFMHLQSMIIRKKTLKGILFNENIKRAEDRDFSIRLYVESKAKFAFKNIVTGIYFQNENSLTSKSVENSLFTCLDHINLFSGYLSSYSLDTSTVSKIEKILYRRYMVVSYCYRKLNDHRSAMESLRKSFKYNISTSQLKEFVKIIISYANQKIRC